jgi:precorrin-2 dehydrogenase / sirohydrochlorin ferrochelatase
LGSVRSRLSAEKKDLFPVFLKLDQRRCVVVGGGKTAEEKVPTLLACGANLVVIAPSATSRIKTWARAKKLVWLERSFALEDLNDAFLCVVATPSKAVNRAVFQEAQQRGILCNVVREGANCNFYYPAVVRRGPLQIAISTAGHSGALAKRIREELEHQFGPEWATWLRWLAEVRSSLYDDPLSPRQRRTLLQKLVSKKKQEEFFRRWGTGSANTPNAKRVV